MKLTFKLAGTALGLLTLSYPFLPAQETTSVDSEAVARAEDVDPTVQTRGPIHEAFAQPSGSNPAPGPIVAKKPPKPIPEIPPEQRPEGDNVQWINGYWAWDQDRSDFLWVSGIYRIPPQGRHWEAGNWIEAEGGWRWVSGYWAPDQTDQLNYQPEPPASLDIGPSTPAPDDNSFYAPGSWIYQNDNYAWQPGYWEANRPGYVWTASRYNWTPRGCLYVNGFWDRPLEDRGLCFAPAYFPRAYWNNIDWCYTPNYAIRPLALLASLFIRPSCNSYYFGDYYDSRYSGLGYHHWGSQGYNNYDPLYSYYRWENRDNPNWIREQRESFLARRAGELPRPGRDLVQQAALLSASNSLTLANRNDLQLAAPITSLGSHLPLTRNPLAPTVGNRLVSDPSRLGSLSGNRGLIPGSPSNRFNNPVISSAPNHARGGLPGTFNSSNGHGNFSSSGLNSRSPNRPSDFSSNAANFSTQPPRANRGNGNNPHGNFTQSPLHSLNNNQSFTDRGRGPVNSFHSSPSHSAAPAPFHEQRFSSPAPQVHHAAPQVSHYSPPVTHNPPPAHFSAPPPVRHSAPPPAHFSAPPPVRHSAPPPAHFSAPPPVHHSAPAPVHQSAPPQVHHSAPQHSAPPSQSSHHKK